MKQSIHNALLQITRVVSRSRILPESRVEVVLRESEKRALFPLCPSLVAWSGPNISPAAIRSRAARICDSRSRDGHDGRRVLQARASEQRAASRATRKTTGSNRVDAYASGNTKTRIVRWGVWKRLPDRVLGTKHVGGV